MNDDGDEKDDVKR
ncbi:hypothetical protein E2C01_090445 [Portunus trituberculatus]|uniref:Uncharacterized protein n=2 Tax=Portuninae TaxID=600346 RepID=A0A5B7JLE2_PORTR|nr:hypothetical protein [Portunus trituberculatus]